MAKPSDGEAEKPAPVVPFEKLKPADQLAFIKSKAKKNCKHGCNGEGFVVFKKMAEAISGAKTGSMVMCRCVANRLEREKREAHNLPRPSLQSTSRGRRR